MDVREKTVTGMAKYIDREALVEWLKRIPLKDLSDGRGLCRVIFEDDFKRAIKKMPKGIIVDVATVRHGRWEKQSGIYSCSECGLTSTNFDNRYCARKGVLIEPKSSRYSVAAVL